MATVDKVRKLALKLQLVNEHGALRQLDSLAVIDFVAGLERDFSVHIPPHEVVPETFRSLEKIASFMDDLARR